MNKIKKIWNIVYAPVLFFLGAMMMLTNNIELGALYIIVASNEVIKN